MSWPLRFFIIVILFFTVALVWLVFYPYGESSTQTSTVGTGPTTGQPISAVIHALAIDMNDKNKPKNRTVLIGDDGVLVVEMRPNPTSNNKEVFVFNNLSSLAAHDKNKDGQIDAADPIYSDIHVAMYNKKNNTFKLTTLKKLGISAVLLDISHLSNEVKNDPKRFKVQAATAILSDNSRRDINLVVMNYDVFKNALVKKPKK